MIAFISAAVLLLASAVVSQQAKSCFKTASIDNYDELLKGDRLGVDLDGITTANNATYSFTHEPRDKLFAGIVQQATFTPESSKSGMTRDFSKCASVASSVNESSFILICDQTNVVFMDLHRSNGSLKSMRFAKVKAKECHQARASTKMGTVYLVCTKDSSPDLDLFEINVLTLAQRTYTFVQDKPELALSNNLAIFLDENTNDATSQLLIFFYEQANENDKGKARFAVVSLEGTDFHSYGYATSETTASGLADGILYGFQGYKNEVVVAIKDSTGLMKMQRCAKTALFRLQCTEAANIEQDTLFLKYHDVFIDTSLNQGEHIEIFSVNMNTVFVGIFSRTKNTYGQTAQIDITGHSLKSITFVYRVGSSIFLTGPTSSEKPGLIDGIIKVKRNPSSFEETSYLDNSPQLTFIRRDYFNSEFADFITIGANKINFYKLKTNTLLIDTSVISDEELRTIALTVKCEGSQNTKGQMKLTIKTMLKVNDDRTFNVPSVNAYAGSRSVQLPVNIGQMRGNAPTLELAGESDSRVQLTYELIDKIDFTYASDALADVKGLKHLGRNVFTAWNDRKQVFFICDMTRDKKKYECVKTYKTVDLQAGTKILDSIVKDERLVVVTASSEKSSGVTITCQYLTDAKIIAEFSIGNIIANQGSIRFIDNQVQVIFIGQYKDIAQEGAYMASFKAAPGETVSDLTKIHDLGEHICPKYLTWAPRAKNTFYISSSCVKAGYDSHVYEFYLDTEATAEARITKTFFVDGSSSYGFCAQSQLINIIDPQFKRIYSFDLLGNLNTKLILPLEEYGFTRIQSYGCDRENDILQVVGCYKPAQETETEKCSLITYRANTRTHPFNRVHSIMPLEGPQVNFVSSTFNNFNDTMLTLLMSKSVDDIQMFGVEVYGPHIKIMTEKVDTDETLNIKWKVSYPELVSKPPITEESTSQIIFSSQKSDVSLRLIDENKRVPTNGELLNVEQYLATVGPYHSLKKVDDFVINDRLTQSNQLSDMKTTLSDAIFHANLIFGLDCSQAGVRELKLFKDGKLAETFATLSSDTSVANLAYVVYNKSAMYFFAFEQRRTSQDILRVFYTTNGGESWTSAKAEIVEQGFRSVRILPAGDNQFYFAGYNNLHRYSIQIIPFQVSDTKLIMELRATWETDFSDKIADFDCLLIESNKIVVVVGVEFEREAHFFYLSTVSALESRLISLESRQKAALVPNTTETNQDIVFKCRIVEDSTLSFRCVNSGKNLFSYVVRYNYDVNLSTADKFINESRVEAVLKNVVNLKPTKVAFAGDFIAFTVQNVLPLGKDEKRQFNKFFKESHLCLVYRLNAAQEKDAKANESYTTDVYKILDSTDFGSDPNADLTNIVPNLFEDSNNVLKLGLNVGCNERSIRVFNLDGLTMSLTFLQAKDKDFKFHIMGLDGEYREVLASQVFKYPDLKREHRNMLILLISTAALFISVLLVGILVCCRTAEESILIADTDLALDNDKTMKLNENDDSDSGTSKL
jgi:hypothetical protein